MRMRLLRFESEKKDLADLRLREWDLTSPWLTRLFPEGTDSFDSAADHVGLYESERLIASVRLCPHSSEVRETHPLFRQHLGTDSRDAEIGRLVTTGSSRDRLQQATRLLIGAGEFYYARKKYRGLHAICRPGKLPFFSRFGFAPAIKEAVYVDDREGYYHLIRADWAVMLENISELRERKDQTWETPLSTDWI